MSISDRHDVSMCRSADTRCETIHDLIDKMASTRPAATFLVSPETGRVMTFRDLHQQVSILASNLRQLGLTRGDKIAFLLDNGLFTAQLFLGVMYGGFVVVPLNVGAGVSQLSYTLDHSDAKIVYVSEEYRSLGEAVLSNVQRAIRVTPADLDAPLAPSETPSIQRI